MSHRPGILLLCLTLGATALPSLAHSESDDGAVRMPRGPVAQAPIGFLDYCLREPVECRSGARQADSLAQLRRDASTLIWSAIRSQRSGAAIETAAVSESATDETGLVYRLDRRPVPVVLPAVLPTVLLRADWTQSRMAVDPLNRVWRTREWPIDTIPETVSDPVLPTAESKESESGDADLTSTALETTDGAAASVVARRMANEEIIDGICCSAKELSVLSLSSAPVAELSTPAGSLAEHAARDWRQRPLTVLRPAVGYDLAGPVVRREGGSGRDVFAWVSLPPSIFGRFDDFAASLAGQLAAATAAQAPVSGIPPGDNEGPGAILTDDLWKRVRQINGLINRQYRSATDARIYGRNEYWARPSGNERRLADCEDYVLEKRAALIDAGVPADALTIATARTWRGEHHAVLILATSEGDFVLDNLVRDVRPWSRSPYRWGVRQSSSDPLVWNAVTEGA